LKNSFILFFVGSSIRDYSYSLLFSQAYNSTSDSLIIFKELLHLIGQSVLNHSTLKMNAALKGAQLIGGGAVVAGLAVEFFIYDGMMM
jgi:hypothetical protein